MNTPSDFVLHEVDPGQENPKDEDAFPDWLLNDLQEQNKRYRDGFEPADELEIVEARLRAKFQSR